MEEVFCACSSSLGTLNILHFERLRSVSGGLKYLTALKSLQLYGLYELRLNETESESESEEKDVEEDVNATDMPWECFAHSLPSLELLSLNKVDELPKGIGCLTSLQSLRIKDLPLKEIPEWIGCLACLQSLKLHCFFKDIESLPEGLRKLNFLNTLELPSIDPVLEENPDRDESIYPQPSLVGKFE